MPTKIGTPTYDEFVRSPDAPQDEQWIEYLQMADRLLVERQQAQVQCDESPFSPDLQNRKQQLDGYLNDYADMYRGKYGLETVKQDPVFIPVFRFFEEYYPIEEPFVVLHGTQDFPLRSIQGFATSDDLRRVNLALREDTALRWWHNGPYGRPCYLFGNCIWELKPAELNASDDGVALMFDQMIQHQQQREGFLDSVSGGSATAVAEAVPNKVRLEVWRREGGKCTNCGGRQELDFEYRIPPATGGSHSADNVQLLCGPCCQQRDE